jgi:hypothetical protein
MSLDPNIVAKELKTTFADLGRSVMHQTWSKDFEYYMMALELVNGAGATIDYFAFPIMPSGITKSENKRISIKKSFKSTLILTSTAFTPQDIMLRGNFGRALKIMAGTNIVMSGVAFANSVKSGVFGLTNGRGLSTPQAQFSRFVKTGYGATKLLQSIIQKSDGSDQTGPYRLYLYNFALGESYLVVAPSKSLTLEQNDAQMNMIWNYTLNLTIIAPLEMVKNITPLSSLKKLFDANVIQNSVNRIAKDVVSYLQTKVHGKI